AWTRRFAGLDLRGSHEALDASTQEVLALYFFGCKLEVAIDVETDIQAHASRRADCRVRHEHDALGERVDAVADLGSRVDLRGVEHAVAVVVETDGDAPPPARTQVRVGGERCDGGERARPVADRLRLRDLFGVELPVAISVDAG